jgi:hypothetical protein
MTCTHEWKDSTTPAGPEWFCVKCKALYSEVKDEPKTAKREWVGLTDKEMYKVWLSVNEESDRMAFGEAVQAKLKELNEM